MRKVKITKKRLCSKEIKRGRAPGIMKEVTEQLKKHEKTE
jgi:hypothetical protein